MCRQTIPVGTPMLQFFKNRCNFACSKPSNTPHRALSIIDNIRRKRHFRLVIIDESTQSSILGMRMSRAKALLLAVIVAAAFIALVLVIAQIWRQQSVARRADYIDTAIRVDSLAAHVSQNDAYAANIMAVLQSKASPIADADTLRQPTPADMPLSVLDASDAERAFVQQIEAEERFNISVLTPIAAEGMIFMPPTAAGGWCDAIYRGSVTAICFSAGKATIVIQHPNDFLSIYRNISEVIIAEGSKVTAGQRLGRGDNAVFELWHNGAKLNYDDYISLPE